MTDIKKTAKSKNAERSKKLRLNKETLKDLSAGDKAKKVKAGRDWGNPTLNEQCDPGTAGCPVGE